MIKVKITRTYNEKGHPDDSIIEELDIPILELPRLLFELSKQASDIKNDQALVVTFPNDNTSAMLVEIYNGYRE